MNDHTATVFSNQAGITVRVCPQGHVYLHVGHTCLTLRKTDFLDLAQIIRATAQHLLMDRRASPQEVRH